MLLMYCNFNVTALYRYLVSRMLRINELLESQLSIHVNVMTQEGQSASDLARARGHEEIVEILNNYEVSNYLQLHTMTCSEPIPTYMYYAYMYDM